MMSAWCLQCICLLNSVGAFCCPEILRACCVGSNVLPIYVSQMVSLPNIPNILVMHCEFPCALDFERLCTFALRSGSVTTTSPPESPSLSAILLPLRRRGDSIVAREQRRRHARYLSLFLHTCVHMMSTLSLTSIWSQSIDLHLVYLFLMSTYVSRHARPDPTQRRFRVMIAIISLRL